MEEPLSCGCFVEGVIFVRGIFNLQEYCCNLFCTRPLHKGNQGCTSLHFWVSRIHQWCSISGVFISGVPIKIQNGAIILAPSSCRVAFGLVKKKGEEQERELSVKRGKSVLRILCEAKLLASFVL